MDIENGIAVPVRPTDPTGPTDIMRKMAVGDSILVPVGSYKRYRAYANYVVADMRRGKKMRELQGQPGGPVWRYTWRKQSDGQYRGWRIE